MVVRDRFRELERRQHCEYLAAAQRQLVGRGVVDLDSVNARHRWTSSTGRNHRHDDVRIARKYRLDAAVAAIPDPALQVPRSRLIGSPGAITDALHPPDNRHMFYRVKTQANSRIIASTASVAPALAWIFFTVPSRSARSTFCIFIASTTASVSPALTS